MRTLAEYQNQLKKMRKNVYIDGELVERDHPELIGGQNVIGITFDAALSNDPEIREIATTTSHLTGERINRFTHVYQSEDDLLKKQKMIRLLAQQTGGCIQRCMGCDVVNALYVSTKEIDDKHGTQYHERFKKYLAWYQRNDLIGNAGQTDVKGDRSKRPSEQADPDLYLRIVEKRKEGIVVCGCKAHNTIAPYADEIIVVPTRALKPEDKDWAVAFAVPADAKGLTLISRPAHPKARKKLLAPYNNFGIVDTMSVFDHVLVPWDRVFMCGESDFGGRLALSFANNHRFSYCGCKPAITDVFIGATALVAEFNGIGKAPHVQDALADMMATAELVYAAGIAASTTAATTPSGAREPNFLFSNCGRYHAGVKLMHEYDVLISTAGGLPATLPFEGDWLNPDTKDYLEKYIMRNPKISAENQHRLFRFLDDFTVSAWCGMEQAAGIHGGGSPIMEKIGIRTNYDLESKKNIIRYLAGIEQ
jgi:4-hydroxyphenylacetate 3-monooxygenase/4-hydroxybutyryl-CoA dehydratase/vinylacetyl-CoA-Delta-isomerase